MSYMPRLLPIHLTTISKVSPGRKCRDRRSLKIATNANEPSRIIKDTSGVRPHPVRAAKICLAKVRNKMVVWVHSAKILRYNIRLRHTEIWTNDGPKLNNGAEG